MFDRGWRGQALEDFDVGGHRDRLKMLRAAEAGALAPTQELADSMIVSDPRVLVADGNSKQFDRL